MQKHSASIFGCKKGCKSCNYLIYTLYCGETGIRTLGTVTRSPHFECGPIDHSGISPIMTKALLEESRSALQGGETGIRTPGTSRYNGFQDRRNRPLCHLSKLLCQVLLFFKSDAKVRIIFEYASIWAKKVRGKEIFAKICLSLPRYNLIKRGL